MEKTWNEILLDLVVGNVYFSVIMNGVSFTVSFEILHTT